MCRVSWAKRDCKLRRLCYPLHILADCWTTSLKVKTKYTCCILMTDVATVSNSGRMHSPKESQLQQTLINYNVHAGSFGVSAIHRTLTWTTWSLTCVRDYSYACVRIHTGVGTPTSQDNIFDWEKLSPFFLVLLTGVRTSALRISSPTLYPLFGATPSPLIH